MEGENIFGQVAVKENAGSNAEDLWKDLVVNAYDGSLLEDIFEKIEVSKKTDTTNAFHKAFFSSIDEN